MSEIRKPQDKVTLKHWIAVIKEEAWEKLTEWEQNFIESIEESVNKYGKLSPKQEDILERIYCDKTE